MKRALVKVFVTAGCVVLGLASVQAHLQQPSPPGTATIRSEPVTRAQWHSALKWQKASCPLVSPDPVGPGVVVLPIDAGRSWIKVECKRMAYQSTQLVYLRTPTAAHQLQFDQYDASSSGQSRRYRSAVLTGHVNARIDPIGLNVLRVYRGIGDCGQRLQYMLDAVGQLRLTELRLRTCPDVPDQTTQPEDWPLHVR